MAAAPARTEISDTYPNPSDAVARIGFGKLWDFVTGLLGTTGVPANALTSLGAAAAGANADVNSFTALASINGGQIAGSRNRVLNGDMRVNQEMAVAATVAVNTGSARFALDGWHGNATTAAGAFTLAQVLDGPAGGSLYSLRATVTTADTGLVAADLYSIRTIIEGASIQDFSFGNASAKTITVSFAVKSSVAGAGVHSGAISNSAGTRSYPFSFTIAAINTWETVKITIPGDTAGTWLITPGSVGMRLTISLGCGSTSTGTTSSWQAINGLGVTGATGLIATNGATLNITDVQCEIGSVATTFERIDFNTALAQCKRRWECSWNYGIAPGTANAPGSMMWARVGAAGAYDLGIRFQVQKFDVPAVTAYKLTDSTSGQVETSNGVGRTATGAAIGLSGCWLSATGCVVGESVYGHYVADARPT